MSINTYAVIVFIVALLITIIGFFITIHKSFDFTYLLIAGAISMIIIITIGIVEVGINSSLVSSKKMSYISLQEINKISPNNNSATLFNVTYTDTIGAGDANEMTGYIGEYATKWNDRVKLYEVIWTITG